MKRVITAATENSLKKLELQVGRQNSYPGYLDKQFGDIIETLRTILKDANVDELEVAKQAANHLEKCLDQVEEFISIHI